MTNHLIFTIVNEFFDKYERHNIPVKLLAIHENYHLMYNYGSGIHLMIGRIKNGCFIEDATGEWWIQMPVDKRGDIRYFKAGDESMQVYLNPTYMACLYEYRTDNIGRIKVYCEGDNLLTTNGILIGSRIEWEGG